MKNKEMKVNKIYYILCLDIGGGTSDITLVKCNGNEFKVIAKK